MTYNEETETKTDPKNKTPKDERHKIVNYFIACLICIAVLVFLFIFIDGLQVSNDPWWDQDSTERLTVEECANDDCTEVSFSEKRYVTYVGEIQLGNGGTPPVGLRSEDKYEIYEIVDEDIVNKWRKTVGLTNELTKNQMLNQIKVFKVSTGASSTVNMYGFCHKDHDQKNCIAFLKTTDSYYYNGQSLGDFDKTYQYRFIGD